MNHKSKTNLIVYLIFGIVITSFVTTVTLSRYMTNASGNGTITVASLDTDILTFSFTPTSLDKPGTTETMNFNIVNFVEGKISDVDQVYSISINTIENLPFTYELQCIDTNGTGIGINIDKSIINTNTQLNGGMLNHSISTTHEYELTITWPNNINDVSLVEELELITVVIDSEQVLN